MLQLRAALVGHIRPHYSTQCGDDCEVRADCTVGQLPDGDGHGLLLAEREETFIGFPAEKKEVFEVPGLSKRTMCVSVRKTIRAATMSL